MVSLSIMFKATQAYWCERKIHYMQHKSIVEWQKDEIGAVWLTRLVKFISFQTSCFQTDRRGTIIRFIVFSERVEKAQHPQRCHILCGAVIRGKSGGKPSFGLHRRESEADKTRCVTQESSLIICGFFMSLRDEEIRAPILLWNDNSKVPTDSQICFKNWAKKVQREYSAVAPVRLLTLGSNKWSHGKTKGGGHHCRNGEWLLIWCQNIFKIWTAPSRLWYAAASVGVARIGLAACRPDARGSFYFPVWHVVRDATKSFRFNCLDRRLRGEGFWFWLLTE